MYRLWRDNMAVIKLFFQEQREHFGGKLDQLHEQAGVPQRDIPTVEELLADAKTDDSKRKLLQNTLAELEFENTEIEFP